MEHHVAENGHHIIHCTQRVMSEYSAHNKGEVAGFPPEVAETVIKKGGGEYAARVFMKKDAPHWRSEHNPPLKAGAIHGVPPGYAKQLISDGLADYATKEHADLVKAKREQADREHLEQMSAAFRAMTAAPAAVAAANPKR